MRKRIAEENEKCSEPPQAPATIAAHDDEVTTSGDGGTNAEAGVDMLETTTPSQARSDSQPSRAGPDLTGSAQY